MNVKLKILESSDIEMVREWRNSDLIQGVSYNREFITSEMQKVWFNNINLKKDQLHWIIYIGESPAGYASIKNIDINNRRCEFASLYIGDSEFLNTGVGAIAEYKIINYLYSNYQHLYKIHCEVMAFNNKVVRLHQKFGFVIEGILKAHYNINDMSENVTLLALFKDKWLERKTELEKILKI